MSDREIAELETTVFANADSTLSDRQAVALLNAWKTRRSKMQAVVDTPSRQQSTTESTYYTPDDDSSKNGVVEKSTTKHGAVVFRQPSSTVDLKLPPSSEDDASIREVTYLLRLNLSWTA